MPEYEVLTMPFKLLPATEDLALGDAELEENEIRGFASVFGEVVDAWTPSIMMQGAFTKTLQESARNIPILWQHDMWAPIGKPTKLFESDNGLVLQAKISRTTKGRDALTLIRDGVISALSIGFEPIKFDFEEQPDGSDMRFIREARLHEISVVTLGADPNALISEVRSGCIAGKLEKGSDKKPHALLEALSGIILAHPDLDNTALIESLAESFRAEAGTPTSTENLADRFRILDLLSMELQIS